MPPFLQNTLAKATDFWSNKSLAQRILLGGLLASLHALAKRPAAA